MHKTIFILSSLVLLLAGCVKDDFIDDSVEPEVRIINVLDTLGIDTTYQFIANYFNETGVQTDADFEWMSSDPAVISIDSSTGLAESLSLGSAIISVAIAGNSSEIMDFHQIAVGVNTVEAEPMVLSGTIATTSSYLLTGDFTLTAVGAGSLLQIDANYQASTALPGLYIYLTNNPTTTSGAYEIGPVSVFSGAHSYNLPDVNVFDYSHVLYYCAPFNVKVGDGQIN